MSDPGPHDFCIIGAGLAGALLACQLARQGAKVLVLDSGPPYTQADARERFHQPKTRDLMDVWRLPESHPSHPAIEADTPCPYPLSNIELKGFGGSTLAWLGNAVRLPPWDFKLRSEHGIGVDWPLSYHDLEPFYDEAERELGVAGCDQGPFRDRAGHTPPLPPLAYTDVEHRYLQALDRLGLGAAILPQARNSRAYDGRPGCQGSFSCIPACPTGAKYTALHHIAKASETGRVEFRHLCHVRRIVADRDRATAVECWHLGSPITLPVRAVVLCAHTVASTRLLLASSSPDHPSGLGNASGCLGHYFMDHPTIMVDGRTSQDRGPHGFQRMVTVDFCNPASRAQDGSFMICYSFVPEFVWQMDASADAPPVDQSYRVVATIDMLPHRDNRLSLSPHKVDQLGDHQPHLHLRFGAYEHAGMAESRRQLQRIMAAMDLDDLTFHGPLFGFGPHPAGTIRMGADPASSVVDPNLKVHGLDNLHVVGSSVFPTMGPLNPSLTIAALALRLAAHLATTGRDTWR